MGGVVVARELGKRYGDSTALRSLTVTIDRGEVFTLIGPNGAGKTTFVRLATGTATPTHGELSLFGVEPNAVDRHRLGVLPQSFRPPDRLTGREIIRYYAGLYDRSRSVSAVLRDVGMSDAADRWYETLSGGEQRRICVGSALVNDPDLLILDEPTTGIDPAGRRRLWELLASLRDDGTTILLTTHDMDEAQIVSDRVGLLNDGRLVSTGSPDELIDEHAGDGRLLIETAEGQAALDHLRSLPFPVALQDRAVIVSGVEPEHIHRVIDRLVETGTTYDRLAWERPSLSDVFFAVTETDRRGGES